MVRGHTHTHTTQHTTADDTYIVLYVYGYMDTSTGMDGWADGCRWMRQTCIYIYVCVHYAYDIWY